jgi:MFS family permease
MSPPDDRIPASQADEKLTTAEKLRNLPWYLAFVTTNSVAIHLTFIGSIFVLYLNELGFNKALLGAVLSLVPFVNIFSIFVAEKISKIGVRKVFLTTFSTRYLIWLPIILSPWIREHFGQEMMAILVVVIVFAFSFFRMINMVALMPWNQEIIPESIRGVFSAKQMTIANTVNIFTVTLAGLFIARSEGIQPFNILFVIGVTFGLLSAWISTRFPGGTSLSDAENSSSIVEIIKIPALDKNFIKFIHGIGWITLAESLFTYVALYMNDEIGLSAGNVVLLQTGVMVGGVLTSFFWGWASDRFGSKPVLHFNMVLIAILPILWFMTPYQSNYSFVVAMGIALIQGASQMGRNIGGTRLLYNRLVPIEFSTSYFALYNACLGLVMGLSQVFGGVLLDALGNISGSIRHFPINSYSILFGLIFIFSLIAILVTITVKSEGEVGVGKFISLFLRGNPLLVFESLIGYSRPKKERETINLTERLGRTQSDLVIDELLASLKDPRFFVRYEAIISIARHHPHPKLTQAIIQILNGNDPALSVISAWALGRIKDPIALDALRHAATHSAYRSVRAHSVRSLGALGDHESIPFILALFQNESDRGLLQAYASALGHLGEASVFEDIMDLMLSSTGQEDRHELLLALARLIGTEDDFILMLRQLSEDYFTNASVIVHALRFGGGTNIDQSLISYCSMEFAKGNLDNAAKSILEISQLFFDGVNDALVKILLLRFSNHLEENSEVLKDLLSLMIFTILSHTENL